MATRPLPDDILRDAWDAAHVHGSVSAAARSVGLPEHTMASRVTSAIKRLNLPHPCSGTAARAFEIAPLPSKSRPIDELLKHRRAESERAERFEEGVNLVKIKLKTPGPIGLAVVGDPHIDNPGSAFALLERHLELFGARSDYIFAGNIGDLQDNWIGRLARLYEESTTTKKEAWALVEWLMHKIQWTWLTDGNHDLWSGGGDPLDWICKSAGVGARRPWGLRLAFQHPGGAETRLHARHDFPGKSMYNPIHGLKREVLHAYRDHVLVAGHQHIGADAGDWIAGMAIQMVRVSGYKFSDSFRHERGLHPRLIHPSALVIVDPEEPDSSRGRAWVAPTVERGVEILDDMRRRWKRRSGQ